MRAQLEQFGPDGRGTFGAVATALGLVGIQVAADHDDEGIAAPALFLFSTVTPDLLHALRVARASGRRVLAIAMSADQVATDDPWLLLDAGASDVLAWDQGSEIPRDIAARLARWATVDEILGSAVVRGNLVGAGPAWTSVLREIVEVATFTDAAILVTGESGTGKELIARLVHTLDARARKAAMIVVDCTTVVPTLSGSEFFGHERGAFTGAVAARDGAFARADGGTLFLDEIGDLPLTLQAELLRVIQEGTFKRVGSDTWRTTRFRLVSATNRPLADAMANGAFRPDLFHRIAAWTFELPPLRERREDIAALARHFLAELLPDGHQITFDPAVMRHLETRAYPGNVRELRLLVARIAARHVGDGPITVGDLPEAERPVAPGDDGRWWEPELEAGVARAVAQGVALTEVARVARDLALARALDTEGRDTARTAGRLAVSERTVQLYRARKRR